MPTTPVGSGIVKLKWLPLVVGWIYGWPLSVTV